MNELFWFIFSTVCFSNFAGEPCELYHCVLESKSFLEKMTVLEHTIPFFLPIRAAENDLLSSNAMVIGSSVVSLFSNSY